MLVALAAHAFSADGLHFYDPQSLAFPPPQRYDCHNQVYYSPTAKSYVLTTRDGFEGDPGRTIGLANSDGDKFKFDTSMAPTCVEKGDADHQLYSQVTWQWHGVFLGIVMVYDANSAAGRVHCRLSWSPSADGLSGWQWVDDAGLTGGDFVPLGEAGGHGDSADSTASVMADRHASRKKTSIRRESDLYDPSRRNGSPPAASGVFSNDFDSHVCFAAASPVLVDGTHRIYYMVRYWQQPPLARCFSFLHRVPTILLGTCCCCATHTRPHAPSSPCFHLVVFCCACAIN